MKIVRFLYTPLFIAVFSIMTVTAQNNSSFPPAKKDSSDQGNIATQWMSHITGWIRDEAILPGPSLRVFAYSGLAMYESQLPDMKNYQSLYQYFTGGKIVYDHKINYYPSACANAAIAEILRNFSLLKNHSNQVDSLELYYYTLYQNQTNSTQLKASVDFGKQVADSIFEWSKTDGMFSPHPPYVVPAGPGLWEASPGKQDYPVPYMPYFGLTRTFCKANIEQLSPGPPPVFSVDSGSVFYKDAMELVTISKHLNHNDSVLVKSWQNDGDKNSNTMTHMTMLLTDMLEKENYSLQRASIIYAKHGIAMFDAVIAVFNTKYLYNVLSPVTYINIYLGKSNWQSFYFYNYYPSYPSNVLGCVAASCYIMETEFGTAYHFTDSTQSALYGSRTYNSLDEFANEVGKNRIVGGLDFRFSVEAGKVQGRKVGDAINELPFKKR